MSYWDKKPNAYRIFFLALFGVLSLIILVNFYRTSTSLTTGIYYGNLPSRFMTVEKVQGVRISSDSSGTAKWENKEIPVGAYILSVNGKEFKTPSDFLHYIFSLPDTSFVAFKIFNKNKVKYEDFVVKKEGLSEKFFKYNYYGFYINNVVPGSTADRAGIKWGDVLLAIDSIECTYDNNLALKYLRSQKPGQVVPYKILRDGEERVFQLKLANYGIQFEFLLLFITGIVFISISLFFALRGARLVQARITALTFLTIGVYLAVTPNLNPNNFDLFSIFRYFVQHTAIIFAFPMVFHSLSYFPKEIPNFVSRKWTFQVGYYLSAVVFVFLVVLFFTENIFYMNYIYPSAIFLLSGFRIGLRIYYKKAFTKEIKAMRRPITIAFLVNVIILYVVAPTIGFSGIFEYDPILFIITEYFIIVAITIPAAYIYTVFKYRLIDVEVKMKLNFKYKLLRIFIMLAFFSLLIFTIYKISGLSFYFPNIHFTGTTLEIFDHGLSEEANDFYEKAVIILFAVFFAFVYWNLWNYISEFIDRKFYRGKIDYRQAAGELLDMMDSRIGKEELGEGLAEKLTKLCSIKRIAVIFFKNEDKVWHQSFRGFDSVSMKNFCSDCNTWLIESLKHFKGGFGIDYLQERMKIFMIEQKIQYIMPIRSKNKLVGVFLIGEKLSESPFNNEDIDFLSSIAGQAAISIENSMLYEDLAQQERMKHELDLARKIQLAQLPNTIPDVKGLDIAGLCIPALDVGGDFYDYLNGSSDSIDIVIGDVSGKGTSAALYMSKVQGIIRTLYEFALEPRELLMRTNLLIHNYLEKNTFVTVSLARINSKAKNFSLVRAGHMPLYIYRNTSKKIEAFTPKGMMLGISRVDYFNANLDVIKSAFAPGDVFLFITDGVIEARNEFNEEYGEERLLDFLANNYALNAQELRNNIISEVVNFSQNMEQFDDITLVVVRAI